MNTKPAETKIPDNIMIRTLKNGLTVIVEPMPDFESVALELHIPGGITHDDERHLGACLLLAELSTRGVDGLSSEELSNEFDARGIRHSEAAGHDRFVYRASLLSEHLGTAMDLVSRMVLNPTLPEDEVDRKSVV